MAVDAVNFNCDESTSLLCKTLKDNQLGKRGVRARQGKCGAADDWWDRNDWGGAGTRWKDRNGWGGAGTRWKDRESGHNEKRAAPGGAALGLSTATVVRNGRQA